VTALAGAPPWAVALLREARVGRLATADARARPLVVPVCFALGEGALYSAIDAKPKRHPGRPLRRLRHIAQNDRVALVVDEYDDDWSRLRWVMVEGRATILGAGPELASAVALLVGKYPQYRAMDLAGQADCAIKIVPDRILHWRWG
jgi:PPOX class probable F420-dependent enzyme